jgi:hypothetical protein
MQTGLLDRRVEGTDRTVHGDVRLDRGVYDRGRRHSSRATLSPDNYERLHHD